MVDYYPLRSNNWKLPEPEPEPEEEQESPPPEVAIDWHVSKDQGDTKSLALSIFLRLPLT